MITYSIRPDYRHALKSEGGRYRIKAHIFEDGQSVKDHGLTIGKNKKFCLSREEWEATQGKVKRGSVAWRHRELIKKAEDKVEQAIQKLDGWDYDEFVRLMNGGVKKSKKDVFQLFEEKIKAEQNIDSWKNAETYQQSLSTLKKFWPKKTLKFSQVTHSFLLEFEAWMKEQGLSTNTISIKERNLRTICKMAIKQNLMHADKYPFKDFSTPQVQGKKKAIPEQVIQEIFDLTFQVIDGQLMVRAALDFPQWAVDHWTVMYLMGGINFRDYAVLKTSDFQNDFEYLDFMRSKTTRLNRTKQKQIALYVPAPAREILRKWSRLSQTDYVHHWLPVHVTQKRRLKVIENKRKTLDKNLKRLQKRKIKDGADHWDFGFSLTTGTARDTHATMRLKYGANVYDVQQALGHSGQSQVIQKHYDNIKLRLNKDEVDKQLLPWVKKENHKIWHT